MPRAHQATPVGSPAGAATASSAVHVRGRALRGVKGFFRGTQRSVPPEETLERIRPCFATAGITRLANITWLDRIGVPVSQSVRPNSQSLSVSAGKGFTLAAATASAAMEGIELFHAEEATLSHFRASYDELAEPRIPIADLSLTKHSLFSSSLPVYWTPAWDVVSQEEVPVPCSAVHMGMSAGHLGRGSYRRTDFHSFQLTSNGLASGNTLLEAMNHALFEVVERDSVTCHRLVWEALGLPPPVVDLATIEHPLVLDLLERFEAAETRPVLFDCTVDTAIPTYMAYLYDLHLRHIGVYRGYGAHVDPEIAMVRALTEAAQGRVIYIAGSRDDVFRHSYYRLRQSDNATVAPALGALEPSVDARDRPSEATPTFEGDTLLAVRKLAEAGIPRVLVVDLSRPDFPISVVKVIVPGLEGYLFEFFAPGPRARAFLEDARR
jgi:YcaO-like protein with predicted kinase domain